MGRWGMLPRYGLMPPCTASCDDRAVGCHSTCPKYKEYRDKMDEHLKHKEDARVAEPWKKTTIRMAQRALKE